MGVGSRLEGGGGTKQKWHDKEEVEEGSRDSSRLNYVKKEKAFLDPYHLAEFKGLVRQNINFCCLVVPYTVPFVNVRASHGKFNKRNRDAF